MCISSIKMNCKSSTLSFPGPYWLKQPTLPKKLLESYRSIWGRIRELKDFEKTINHSIQ